MNIGSLSIGQDILIGAKIKSIKYEGGAHFDTIGVELSHWDSPDSQKTLFVEPDNIESEYSDLLALLAEVIRWRALSDQFLLSLEELEAAGIVRNGETGVVTVTPAG